MHDLGVGYGQDFTEWEHDRVFACDCDLGFAGYACEQRVCPDGDDPDQDAGRRVCAGRGVCNHSDGMCECFRGYGGFDCSIKL